MKRLLDHPKTIINCWTSKDNQNKNRVASRATTILPAIRNLRRNLFSISKRKLVLRGRRAMKLRPPRRPKLRKRKNPSKN